MTARQGEIGGEYHWTGLPPEPLISWPQSHRLFSLGRVAISCLWHSLQPNQRALWLPDYFCPETSSYWTRSGIPIRSYVDNPALSCPEWATIKPRPGDLVLSVNYFGVRTSDAWRRWQHDHPGVLVVEDHSHDPLSTWAKTSSADYALASLRKVFAAPEGAILWSPRGLPLPEEPSGCDWRGSACKLAAMIFKAEYLKSEKHDPDLKATFRGLQIEGEQAFIDSPDQCMAPWSGHLLKEGFPEVWRERRLANVRSLVEHFATHTTIRPLFLDWPPGHCPFNFVVLCPSRDRRVQIARDCIAADIYTTVHWQLDKSATGTSLELSERILTVPVDHRCSATDLERIVAVLHKAATN